MESIAHAVACFISNHIACISVTAVMTIWAALSTWWHRRIDGKIMRAIRESGVPLSASKIANSIHKRVAKVEGRLWDLADREKVIEDRSNVDGERRWTAPTTRDKFLRRG